MSFSVIDHYEGFEKNNFIKRDENQINLLHKLSLSWDQYNQNNLFFSKRKKLGVYIPVSYTHLTLPTIYSV